MKLNEKWLLSSATGNVFWASFPLTLRPKFAAFLLAKQL